MSRKDLYKIGKKWDCRELTDSIKEALDDRINENLPVIWLIDGGQGNGKTTLAVHIADEVNKIHNLPPMDLELNNHPQLAMGGEEFMSYFDKAIVKKFPCIIYDEAGDFQKGGAMTSFNLQISKIFQKIRSGNMLILLCLPNFCIIDNRLFKDDAIRASFHCHSKQIYKTYSKFKAYDLEATLWVQYWHNEKLPQPRQRDAYRICFPLFNGNFKDLNKDRSKKLDTLSKFGKAKERQRLYLSNKGYISIKGIAKELNRSRIWVRKKMSKFNIKPDDNMGIENYYNKRVIKRLEGELKR